MAIEEKILKIENLVGYYRGTFGTVHAVENVSLSVNSGEVVGIAGESGSGKSTLCELISGVPRPLLFYEDGILNIRGNDIYQIDQKKFRTEILSKVVGYVPQSSMNSLNPVLKIKKFLLDVMRQRTSSRTDKKADDYLKKEDLDVLKDAIEHFEQLGLDKKVLNLYPHELSGGMKQRTVIAISTLFNPKLLLLDEPTSALDVTTQRKLLDLFVDLKKRGIVETILFVSHDIPTLRQICDRGVIMYAGQIVEDTDMDTIIEDPKHPYTQALVGAIVSFNPDGSIEKDLTRIEGRPPDLRNPPKGCRFHPRCKSAMPICSQKEPPIFKLGEKQHRVKCWLYKSEQTSEDNKNPIKKELKVEREVK